MTRFNNGVSSSSSTSTSSSTKTSSIAAAASSAATAAAQTKMGKTCSTTFISSSSTSPSSFSTSTSPLTIDYNNNNNEKSMVKLIGQPCGNHGSYTFYKAFSYRQNKSDQFERILMLGDFFFVKISPNDDPCIGELQLVWYDHQHDQQLSSTRLYFLPEQTPEGRLSHHGQHEVLAAHDKVILKLTDLVTWITHKVDWIAGSPYKWKPPKQDNMSLSSSSSSTSASTENKQTLSSLAFIHNQNVIQHTIESLPFLTLQQRLISSSSCKIIHTNSNINNSNNINNFNNRIMNELSSVLNHNNKNNDGIININNDNNNIDLNHQQQPQHQQLQSINNFNEYDDLKNKKFKSSRLDFSDIIQLKLKTNENQNDLSTVVVLSYNRYCHYRNLLKRIEGKENELMNDFVVQNLLTELGIPQQRKERVHILFCRDTFNHEAILNNDLNCDHLAPKFKGRPKKRKHKIIQRPSSPDESISSSEENGKSFLPRRTRRSAAASALTVNNSQQTISLMKNPNTHQFQQQNNLNNNHHNQQYYHHRRKRKNKIQQKQSTIKSTIKIENDEKSLNDNHNINNNNSNDNDEQDNDDNDWFELRKTNTNTNNNKKINTGKENNKMAANRSANMKNIKNKGNINNCNNNNNNDNNNGAMNILINDNFKCKENFLKELNQFMNKRKTPIQRVPNMGFKKIDLFVFFTQAQKYGGYDKITKNRLWKKLYDDLGGDKRSTSAATCARRHYEKLLLPFEKKLNLKSKDYDYSNKNNNKQQKQSSTSTVNMMNSEEKESVDDENHDDSVVKNVDDDDEKDSDLDIDFDSNITSNDDNKIPDNFSNSSESNECLNDNDSNKDADNNSGDDDKDNNNDDENNNYVDRKNSESQISPKEIENGDEKCNNSPKSFTLTINETNEIEESSSTLVINEKIKNTTDDENEMIVLKKLDHNQTSIKLRERGIKLSEPEGECEIIVSRLNDSQMKNGNIVDEKTKMKVYTDDEEEMKIIPISNDSIKNLSFPEKMIKAYHEVETEQNNNEIDEMIQIKRINDHNIVDNKCESTDEQNMANKRIKLSDENSNGYIKNENDNDKCIVTKIVPSIFDDVNNNNQSINRQFIINSTILPMNNTTSDPKVTLSYINSHPKMTALVHPTQRELNDNNNDLLKNHDSNMKNNNIKNDLKIVADYDNNVFNPKSPLKNIDQIEINNHRQEKMTSLLHSISNLIPNATTNVVNEKIDKISQINSIQQQQQQQTQPNESVIKNNSLQNMFRLPKPLESPKLSSIKNEKNSIHSSSSLENVAKFKHIQPLPAHNNNIRINNKNIFSHNNINHNTSIQHLPVVIDEILDLSMKKYSKTNNNDQKINDRISNNAESKSSNQLSEECGGILLDLRAKNKIQIPNNNSINDFDHKLSTVHLQNSMTPSKLLSSNIIHSSAEFPTNSKYNRHHRQNSIKHEIQNSINNCNNIFNHNSSNDNRQLYTNNINHHLINHHNDHFAKQLTATNKSSSKKANRHQQQKQKLQTNSTRPINNNHNRQMNVPSISDYNPRLPSFIGSHHGHHPYWSNLIGNNDVIPQFPLGSMLSLYSNAANGSNISSIDSASNNLMTSNPINNNNNSHQHQVRNQTHFSASMIPQHNLPSSSSSTVTTAALGSSPNSLSSAKLYEAYNATNNTIANPFLQFLNDQNNFNTYVNLLAYHTSSKMVPK